MQCPSVPQCHADSCLLGWFLSLMSRSLWCPCSASNGTELGTGLARVFDWVNSQLEPWITETIVTEAPLVTELSHLQQTVFFLVCFPAASFFAFIVVCWHH